MGILRTKCGTEFIVDDSLMDIISEGVWYFSRIGYVMGCCENKLQYLHRVLFGALPGEMVDHANRNPLDNRLCNLRLCTKSQNGANSKKRKSFYSRYRGVTKSKQKSHWKKPWIASIMSNRQRKHLGLFAFQEEAAPAYNKKAKELFGEFACLNEI